VTVTRRLPSVTDQSPDTNKEPADLTNEALEDELTIAASGSEHDEEREDRLEELLEEREHRSDETA
jgi:hypothetical protein